MKRRFFFSLDGENTGGNSAETETAEQASAPAIDQNLAEGNTVEQDAAAETSEQSENEQDA